MFRTQALSICQAKDIQFVGEEKETCKLTYKYILGSSAATKYL